MRTIKLTQGYSTVVDDEDYERLAKYRWHVLRTGRYLYAVRKTRGQPRRTLLMHIDIMQPPPGIRVDHKNGDTLNNTRGNLRCATNSQNLANHRLPSSGSSQYYGVSWIARDCRWRAMAGGIHIGYFKVEADAALAYNRLALELYGEFARLNEIPGERNAQAVSHHDDGDTTCNT